jgi:tetratricopeptide (TPR) repeat protein
MRRIYALMFTVSIISSTLWGQRNPHQQLYQTFLLEQQGQFAKAIQDLRPLICSNALCRVESGRAWTLLGFAYQEQGQYQQAQNAYEQSLHIFKGDIGHIADYASTLDYLARLFRDTSQQKMATKLWLKAVRIDEQRGDHSGAGRIYTGLAGLAIERGHIRDAKSILDKAIAQSKMTTEMTEDDFADLSAAQARIASAEGDTTEAIVEYENALKSWKQQHGMQHPLTGWGYLLLGKALAANGQLQDALVNMRQGLTVLDATIGPRNPKYLAGEIAYATVLEQSGMRVEGLQLKSEAERSLATLIGHQCMDCTVSVAALR